MDGHVERPHVVEQQERVDLRKRRRRERAAHLEPPALELADGGEISSEDILAAQMAAKAGGDAKSGHHLGITYVAFTATPKDKTLQLFGTRPDPARQPAPDNIPAPFHVYSMRQAIEEGFILDVLRNYLSYKLAFKLAHQGKDYDEKTVERAMWFPEYLPIRFEA